MPCSSTPARTRCSTYSRLRVLQHDRVDALPVQQVRQQQPGRPGADDPDLGAHATSLVALPPGGCHAERLG